MNEEQLRARLEAVDVPPSHLELDVLVRAGRRRAFRRRSAQAAGSMALVTGVLLAVPSILTRTESPPAVQPGAASATASAPAKADSVDRCRMTELPVPPGMTNVAVDAVDPTGRYVIGHDVVNQDFRPILWTDGQPKALSMPAQSVEVSAVNASGVVVGLVLDAEQEYVFRYENGVYTKLRTTPGSWHAYPAPAINAAGDIIINAEPSGNVEGKDSVILYWKAGSTTAVRVPLPTEANAYGITDDGKIVGAMYKDGRADTPYVWDLQGNGRKLELPAGQTASVYAVRGDWATGGLWPALTPALWNIRTGKVTNLGTPNAKSTTVLEQGVPKVRTEGRGPGNAVNASGWVVGDGAVLRDGPDIELEVPSGRTGRAKDVSDTGMVVGQEIASGGDEEMNLGPRVWRC